MIETTKHPRPSGETTTARTLSVDLVEQYHRDGYVHIPRVLGGSEVEEYLADAGTQLDRQRLVSWNAAEGGNVMDWVPEPENASELMRRLALHPEITGIAERLAGQPLRMFKSELLRKHTSDSAPTPMHIDAPAFPIAAAPVTLTAWVALVDVPVQRGCLTFIPGSHRWPEDAIPTVGEPYEARPELRWWPHVTVPVRAGDCTFHDARLVHSAGANHTDMARISLATVYMDAEAVYHPDPDAWYQDTVPDREPGQRLDGARYPRIS
ncbi:MULTISPECIES: phytanoyl-CoA dioxygenase family protein [Nocardia]|uniref:phytanoyl-CoA dioxygenase family protein n=1 Tax=Nocardia TaxID=1817 RepID=UPI001357ED1A|nr:MULTISPECIES: phytanoyl-CoA dioxygenase family protein [Nocardia]MBF6204205.1 phytanoyl-CoA dioxygenase family protein [Streptomyces gardneri]